MKIWIGLFFFSLSAHANTPLKVKDIALGGSMSCAVMENDDIKCWGFTRRGGGFFGVPRERRYHHAPSIGLRPSQMGNNTPTLKSFGKKVRELKVGREYVCALHPNFETTCWSNMNSPRELLFDQGLQLKKLALGFAHRCGIFTDDTVRCWGYNRGFQLGYYSRGWSGRSIPYVAQGDPLKPVFTKNSNDPPIDITASDSTTCALFQSGAVRCWGVKTVYDQFGEQGIESTRINDSKLAIDFGTENGRPLKATRIFSSAQSRHFCAEFSNGKLKCWGKNFDGQLGIGSIRPVGLSPGTMGNALPFVSLGAGLVPIDFALGGRSSCAVFVSGAVKCWGAGEDGVTGQENKETIGDTPDTLGDYMPYVFLGHQKSVVKLAVGGEGYGSHACALLQEGRIKCWGSNLYGQLGLGLPSNTVIGILSDQMGDNLPYVDLGTK